MEDPARVTDATGPFGKIKSSFIPNGGVATARRAQSRPPVLGVHGRALAAPLSAASVTTPRRQVVQVAPLRVKAVGAASLLVQVPWKPTVTEPPAAMEPL